MTDINVVVLMGRLTRDAELKYTKSGLPVARFSIAVKRSRKQDDQWVEESSFFDVDFYGKSAESVHKYLVKCAPPGQRARRTERLHIFETAVVAVF
ncbi:MAG: single-strand DNA-binding protein [Spirochaetes bacterium]|nr:MAG: single-strand DNA-binding protein [Spirochaetota bacterium]